MTTATKDKRLHAAWRETAPRFLIVEGAVVRYGDRPCIVTDIKQDDDGKWQGIEPVAQSPASVALTVR